ncbi:MAG: hypothetical protein L0G99_15840, partial [Propionibacteriales bacterium]|nr:hypothetical protein [Propionibacteriales bacterium]
LLAAVLTWWALPRLTAESRRGGAIRWSGVIMVCTVTAVLAAAHFGSFTYLSVLLLPSAWGGSSYPAALLIYGLAGLGGTMACSRFLDQHPGGTAVAVLLSLLAGFAMLFAGLSSPAVMIILGLIAWGAAFSALPPVLQRGVLRAGPGAAARVSAWYLVAFQIGIAGGSAVGGVTLASRGGSSLLIGSLVLTVLASVGVVIGRRWFGQGP